MGTSSAPTPVYQQPQLDPAFARLMQQTQEQDVSAIQEQLKGNTASLMARYGTLLTMANLGSANIAATPAAALRKSA